MQGQRQRAPKRQMLQQRAGLGLSLSLGPSLTVTLLPNVHRPAASCRQTSSSKGSRSSSRGSAPQRGGHRSTASCQPRPHPQATSSSTTSSRQQGTAQSPRLQLQLRVLRRPQDRLGCVCRQPRMHRVLPCAGSAPLSCPPATQMQQRLWLRQRRTLHSRGTCRLTKLKWLLLRLRRQWWKQQLMLVLQQGQLRGGARKNQCRGQPLRKPRQHSNCPCQQQPRWLLHRQQFRHLLHRQQSSLH